MIEQKFHFGQQIGEAAIGGAESVISLLGKCLPASITSINGSIATVKLELNTDAAFPQLVVPIAGSQYVREPLQQGDMGVLISADASLFAVSGNGNTPADLTRPGNLSAMFFVPLGNKNWKAVSNQMLVLTGLSDVMLRNNTHQTIIEDQYMAWNLLLTTVLTAVDTQLKALGQPGITALLAAVVNPIKARV